jgi:hypothetical protein
MAPGDEFLIQLPSCLIVRKDSVVSDESGRRLKPNAEVGIYSSSIADGYAPRSSPIVLGPTGT